MKVAFAKPATARQRREEALAVELTEARRRVIHPLHAVLLASMLPLFLGALLSDWAYSSTYQVQWTNFASWLVAGGLIFTGLALVWAVIDSLRGRAGWIYPALLLAVFLAGFVNALVHAKDAWAAMPTGLILSIIVLLLAIGAIWAGFSSLNSVRRL
jgi:uncharacterized membrane protein